MPSAQQFTQIFIKINGAPAPEELMAMLEEAVVDSSLHLPDMFTILFQDPRLEWIDNALFKIGNSIEIEVQTGQEQGGLKGKLISGEITALEPNFSDQGLTTLLVRGYDKTHRLHRGRKTQTFLKQTDSAIVQKIAGEAGLSAMVDATSEMHDYVLRNNQTPMEFILSRAERVGYQVYTENGALYFKKGDANRGDGPTFKFGENLFSFRPTLTTGHQADKVVVKGWDPKGKKEIVGEAQPNSQLNPGGVAKTGSATAKVFGAAEAVVTNQPVFTPGEAKSLATGLSNDMTREFIQAEGECSGDPRVRAGWNITIQGVGQQFSGKYFVTSATHTYNESGYRTSFSINGRHPNTFTHLLHSNGSGGSNGHILMQGVVTGLVTNNKDEENLGRVKVKYAWLGEIESDWVRIAAPMGGAERGFYYLPEVNDEVLIAFEHGNPHRPYIVGTLWNSRDKPPEPNNQAVGADGKVNRRVLKSRSGHLIVLDDTQGKEQIVIRDKTGKNEVIIDSAKNSISINVQKDYSLDATGNVTIDSKGNVTVSSKGNVSIESIGNLNLKAAGMLNIKGNKVSIDGGPMTEVKGVMVSVNGSATTEVRGGIVKIN